MNAQVATIPPQPSGPAEGMAARIRNHDWAATPLGPRAYWPQSLKTVVDVMLASPSMISLVWGAEAIHLYNDEFTALLREHHTAALGRSAFEMFARSRGAFADDLAAGMAGKSARLLAQRYPVLRDGRLQDAWFDVDYAPVRDESGQVAGVLWTLRDVTAQVVAQAALRESEVRHRLLVGSWAQAVWEVDAQGVVVTDSPSWRAYTGQTLEERLGYGWVDAIHPDDRAYAERQWRESVAAEQLVDAEFRLRTADGGWRWTNVRAAPMRATDGTILRWVGMNIDIDARRRAEEALHASEARQQVLIEGVPQLVWRAVEEGRWTWASPQWTDFTAQSREDSRGHGWLGPVHPDDRAPVRATWHEAATRGAFDAEFRLLHPREGRYRWVQARATPVRDERGAIVEWLGTCTDVDDLRGLQDRQRLLLAELQHRVRNILAVIRSIVSRSDDGERSTEEYVQHLQGRISALARTQMLLTRNAGAGINLEEMIRDELLAQVAGEARYTLDGPDIELSPKAAEVLTLAIHELATNATKYGAFARADGRLAIAWRIEERDREPWLVLDWTESGVPIVDAVPRRQGFGSELIARRFPYELGGMGSFTLRPGGLASRIEFPLRAGDSILRTDAIDR